ERGRRDHLGCGLGRGGEAEVPAGLEGAQALHPHRPPAEVGLVHADVIDLALRRVARRAAWPGQIRHAHAWTIGARSVDEAAAAVAARGAGDLEQAVALEVTGEAQGITLAR